MCCTARTRRVEPEAATSCYAGRAAQADNSRPHRALEMTLLHHRTFAAALTVLATSLCLNPTASAQTAPVKPATKVVKPSAKPAARKVAPVEAPLPKAEGEQLAAAALTHFGDYACEFEQAVNVNVTPKNDGYVNVRFKAQTWTMKPVLSSTGALRLEDVKGRMLMLQIANKSMLMDTKIGQRLVDGCIHEKQRLATAAAAAAPQPAGEGLLQGGAAPASAPK